MFAALRELLSLIGESAMPSHAKYHLNLSGQISRQYRRLEWSAEFVPTPRRICGHNGSARYSPYEASIEALPGRERLLRLSPESRLELLATALLHCETVSAAWQRQRDAVRRNRLGGAEFTNSKRQRVRVVTLREVVAQIDTERADSESLAESVACALNNLATGFGSYLLATEDVEMAAKLAGISGRTARRHIAAVRDSWESAEIRGQI